MLEILHTLAKYRALFLVLFEIFLIVVLVYIVRALYEKWMRGKSDIKKEDRQRILSSGNFKGGIREGKRQALIRHIVAPDGVDPGPNSYLPLSDGGKEVYVRSVTLVKLPRKVRYADTLKELLNFPNCTSTCFVEPIDSSEMAHKLDKQINILGAEQYAEKGDVNRLRRLGHQEAEVTRWADEVDLGDKKFFNVGFLFTFVAESVDELNRITDSFRALALNKKMDISNCYGVQAEAFLANMPFNRVGNGTFKNIDSDAVKMFLMDQGSVSVILNYTTDYFSHKIGVPLGRNLFTGMPYIFNLADPSHDGMTCVMCGKTRSGKSATIKMLIERMLPQGWRFVNIDSQTRKGTSGGEYVTSAEINNGINFQISSKNNNILNPFHVEESMEFVKTSADSGVERKTLDLNGAVTEMLCTLRTMIINGAVTQEGVNANIQFDTTFDSDVTAILTDVVKELFKERGIIHGDADSLYEEGNTVEGGMLQSGYVPKALPTVTECYEKLLIYKWANKDEKMDGAYKYILNNLREYVRVLFYVEESRKFFTESQVKSSPQIRMGGRGYVYINEEDEEEPVIEIRGIRPYFDGQSTITLSRECPITNIDISQLTDSERKVAREIAVRFVNEHYIKKNSEILEHADRLICIVDEAHECMEYEYGRKTFANAARTAAKRNVGIIFSTQTVVEWDRHPETQDILRQAAVKMIFKQDGKDRHRIKEALNITESQANIITDMLGVVTDKEDPEAARRHRGEMCMIDGEQVTFVKVDYLRKTESLSVETDASLVMKKINGK